MVMKKAMRRGFADSISIRSLSSYGPSSKMRMPSPASSLRSERHIYASVTSNSSGYRSRNDVDDLALGSILDPSFYKKRIQTRPRADAAQSSRSHVIKPHLQPLLETSQTDIKSGHYETEIM